MRLSEGLMRRQGGNGHAASLEKPCSWADDLTASAAQILIWFSIPRLCAGLILPCLLFTAFSTCRYPPTHTHTHTHVRAEAHQFGVLHEDKCEARHAESGPWTLRGTGKESSVPWKAIPKETLMLWLV